MAFFMKFRGILRSSKSLLKKFEIQLAKSSSLKTPNRALKSQQSLLTFKTTHKHPPKMSNTQKSILVKFVRSLYESDAVDGLPPKRDILKFISKYASDDQVTTTKKKSKKELPPEILDLKEEYTQKLGKKPKGPKANNIEWLKNKISESESDSDSDKDELLQLKEEYTEKLGKKPSGPKANNIEWLKTKIVEKEEADILDEDSEDEEGAGVGLDTPTLELTQTTEKFTFEGVEYTKTLDDDGNWMVEDSDENAVGEWIEKGSSGYINWEEPCWEEIHHDHDDYTGEE